MPLNARYHRVTSGSRVLLDIMYKPVPRPLPTSLPILPVEICQKIYRYTGKYDKPCLGMSCRLFRGIAYDYGPVISEWSLQGLRKTNEGSRFTAAADSGTHSYGGKVRPVLARRALVSLATDNPAFRPIDRVVLRRPEGDCIELQMLLVGVCVEQYIDEN